MAILTPHDREVAESRVTPCFESLESWERREQELRAFVASSMKEGVDYGEPHRGESNKQESSKQKGGERKLALLKPGAVKLRGYYGLTTNTECVEKVIDATGHDHGGEPYYYYHMRVHVKKLSVYICSSDGICNSWEKKYRSRNAERVCPQCGEATVFRSNKEGQAWFCWRAKGGCGAGFQEGDPAIESQPGKRPNPNIHDEDNTIESMAEKRAFVAAIRIACCADSVFNLDEEELEAAAHRDEQPEPDTPPVHRSTMKTASDAPQNEVKQPEKPAAPPASEEPDLATITRGQRLGYADDLRQKAGLENFAAYQNWLRKHTGREGLRSPSDLTDDEIVHVIVQLRRKIDGAPEPPDGGGQDARVEGPQNLDPPGHSEADDPFVNGQADSQTEPAPASEMGDGTEETPRDPFAEPQSALPLGSEADPTETYLLNADVPSDKGGRAKLLAQILKACGIEGASTIVWCKQQGFRSTALGYQDWDALASMIHTAREHLKGCHAGAEGRAA